MSGATMEEHQWQGRQMFISGIAGTLASIALLVLAFIFAPRACAAEPSGVPLTRLEALTSVTKQAMTEAARLTGRPPITKIPVVGFLPSKVLQARYCGAKDCRAVVSAQDNGVIFMDEHLDPINDPVSFSILIHECVHVIQDAAKDNPKDCLDGFRLEKEAAYAQAQWLREQNNILGSVVLNNLRLYRCPTAP